MVSIRAAVAADAPLILALIRELAAYEREPDAVVATEADLLRDGFGAEPRFRVLIAEDGGEPAGFALYCHVYSTWRPTLERTDAGASSRAHRAPPASDRARWAMHC